MKKMTFKPSRNVMSATDITDEYFSELASAASNSGYDLSVDSNYNMKLSCKEDDDMMPEIEVMTKKDNGQITFEPILTFPVIDTSEFGDADDMEYWIDRWNRVAKLITRIKRTVFDINY